MSEYKHKKTGHIAKPGNNVAYRILSDDRLITEGYIDKRYVEDSLDWEKIVKKDYLVTSLSHRHATHNFILFNGTWITNDTRTESLYGSDIKPLMEADWKMHSVKRLSDNQEFSVGDEIVIMGSAIIYKIRSIKEINNVLWITTENLGRLFAGDTQLSCIESYKPVLFTTEDGVDIFKWGTYLYWIIRKVDTWSPLYLRWVTVTQSNYTSCLKDKVNPEYKVFSTKEAADEFIEKNKPVERFFITTDGVKLKLGDHLWAVRIADLTIISDFIYVYNYHVDATPEDRADWKHLHFSSKEAADRYVQLNEKSLSLRDVSDAISNVIVQGVHGRILVNELVEALILKSKQ